MAVEQVVLDLPASSTEATNTIPQFAVVHYDVTSAFGAVRSGNANAGPVMGINQSVDVSSTGVVNQPVNPGSGMAVRVLGVSRAIVSAVTVIGAPLYSLASGNGQVSNAAAVLPGNGMIGFGLEAGTTAGDVVSVMIAPSLQPALKQLGTFAAPLTANGTANTNQTHAHGLGYTPTVVLITGVQGTSGLVSLSAAPDATNITEKSPVISATFIAYVA